MMIKSIKTHSIKLKKLYYHCNKKIIFSKNHHRNMVVFLYLNEKTCQVLDAPDQISTELYSHTTLKN